MTAPEPEFAPYPLKMAPCPSPRPWGGDRLRALLGKSFDPEPPAGEPIGESWELSDHPHGRSRVANGPMAGWLFGDLYARFPRALCGCERPPARFPLLVKYIDAAGDLSIQVHPDDALAAPRGDRGKTECWMVMDCPPGAEAIYGLKEWASAEALREAARAGDFEPLVRRVPIRPGSFLRMPAGTVHALLAGTLVCEVQQSSDLTYRLWDWGRQPARPLHLAEAIEAAHYGPGNAPEVIETAEMRGERLLESNPYFEARLVALAGAEPLAWRAENRRGLVVCVLEGSAGWSAEGSPASLFRGELRRGETWFFPAGIDGARLEPGAAGVRLLVSRSLEME